MVAPAKVGDTRLHVAEQAGFSVGDIVEIKTLADDGDVICLETRTVVGFGSGYRQALRA